MNGVDVEPSVRKAAYDELFLGWEKHLNHVQLGLLITACQDFLERLSKLNPPPAALDLGIYRPDPTEWVHVNDEDRMREELDEDWTVTPRTQINHEDRSQP